MHYFKKNIGDYAKKTGRLSMLQHGAYTLLIDSCYDRERFPTLDEAIEWTWASTKEEVEAVEFVLRRFFTIVDDRYVQSRIQEEIAEYHSMSETNKRIATEREAKRKANGTDGARTVHESSPSVNEAPPNQEPRTKNHKPRTINQKINTSASAPPDGVSVSVWQDFTQLRKAKKAPITPSAIAGIKREADKGGLTLEAALEECCSRGWVGFKAAWMVERTPPANVTQLTVPSKQGIDPNLARIINEQLSGVVKPPSSEMRAKLAALRGAH